MRTSEAATIAAVTKQNPQQVRFVMIDPRDFLAFQI
jgi:hypothetical protein